MKKTKNSRETLERAWLERGEKVGRELGQPESRALELKSMFDAMDLSPKDTHIEVMNYCQDEGITPVVQSDLDADTKRVVGRMLWSAKRRAAFEQVQSDLIFEFDSGCANELIRKMYEKKDENRE